MNNLVSLIFLNVFLGTVVGLKIICEPSCSLPLAGILKNKNDFKGKKIGVVITGGNIDLSNLPF